MNVKDNFFTGLVCGIAAPAAAFSIYAKTRFPEESLMIVMEHVKALGILATIISLSTFINLLVFFIFIWTKADRSSKGVLAATFMYAFTVLFLKLV
jgi:hypothetical protein